MTQTSASIPRHHRPTSDPSSHYSSSTAVNMVRSSSAEPGKSTKRKGTRSVSTLTPSQLARKRANDREAQRAIRARTKEHIERLERELEELKSKQSRDQTVQELLRRNKALEDELNRLRENMGVGINSSPYSGATVYDDNLSTGSGHIPSPRTSPFPSGDYSPMPEYAQQHYVPMSATSCETWASAVPCPVPSNVSSPSSSGNAEDYAQAGYIPTSVPASMLPSNHTSPTTISPVAKDVKMEFEEVDHGFRLGNPPMPAAPQTYLQHHQQSAWNAVYPVYYPQAQSSVH